MKECKTVQAGILGLGVFLGLTLLGYLLADGALRFKAMERTVTVKGLAEKEVQADLVIWPIQFAVADNDLTALYTRIEANTAKVKSFLQQQGIEEQAISGAAPAITDKSAQQYGTGQRAEFRYTALQTVTVYSTEVAKVRQVMSQLSVLGKEGIAFSGEGYQGRPEYLFTELNAIKPQMVEEATRNAREVANKFAADSDSQLGKIRRASQGQFSIIDRDRNNPHIKKVRVVSTVEYYLSD
ncbi:SIMPL domain-containing protein [Neptuniibacter sp. CAU 1671]|uniref:SIMPL domain-containing protein n=1 Tax=Neptuniibacter sp. CAU 1671 TaxID=3032593 RepID=UPI0023DB3A6E|nr:SIMPL domain-containing protein [Neptuniibacter sp. CAU 1671]MDF2182639.1 SIMPL domain-containing protein [Neptuniibacter sp. CAU 1671]